MTIATPHLALRPLTKPSPKQIAWLRDPKVVRFSEQRHRNHTLSTQLRYVNSFAGRSRLWAIVRIADGEHIGNLSAMVDEPNGVAEVGILLGERSSWGKGFGKEAWRAACTWLLSEGGLRKLEAGCMRDNVAMLEILKGSGFVMEGERTNHFLLDGRPVGMVLFGRPR